MGFPLLPGARCRLHGQYSRGQSPALPAALLSGSWSADGRWLPRFPDGQARVFTIYIRIIDTIIFHNFLYFPVVVVKGDANMKVIPGMCFGHLTTKWNWKNHSCRKVWKCTCDCGGYCYVKEEALMLGIVKDCGAECHLKTH